jgi:outer membrane protein assembly factor BamB
MNKAIIAAISVLVAMAGGSAASADPTLRPAFSAGSGQVQGYAGQDWPQWRGPTRDGIVHGGPKLMDSWPKDGPKLLWKSAPVPGCMRAPQNDGGCGSISVAGGRAFVFVNTGAVLRPEDSKDLTSTNKPGRIDTVLCWDASSGKEIWRRCFSGQAGHQTAHSWWSWYPASSTPTIWDDKCYVAGSAGFYCLSAKDGTVVWQAKAGYTCSSPLVANGTVFAIDSDASGNGGALTAYNARDGKVLWRQPKVNWPYGSPVMWTCDGKSYLISYASFNEQQAQQSVFCYVDPDNGARQPVASATRWPLAGGQVLRIAVDG